MRFSQWKSFNDYDFRESFFLLIEHMAFPKSYNMIVQRLLNIKRFDNSSEVILLH